MEIVFTASFTFRHLDTPEMYTNVNSSGLLHQPTAFSLTEKVVFFEVTAKEILALYCHGAAEKCCHLNSSVLEELRNKNTNPLYNSM